MPASPELLPKPLPKMTAQLPLCRRRICGVPNVFPMLLPQLVTLAQLIVPLFHSPMTMLEALPSEKLLSGLVMSSAKMAAPPTPRPPTSQVCHWPPKNRSPEPGVASTKKLWPYCEFALSSTGSVHSRFAPTAGVTPWIPCTMVWVFELLVQPPTADGNAA